MSPTLIGFVDVQPDWWQAEDADLAWIESQQRELEHEDDEDDRDPHSFK